MVDSHGLKRGAHLVLLMGLAVLCWQTIVNGVAMSVRRADPALANRLAPNNALALAGLAKKWLVRDPPAAEDAARRALLRDPTSASAAGSLSMIRGAAGNATGSGKLLAYSQTLSRRDLPTQLWAIEMAVARNDIKNALQHYDVALRAGRSTPNLLFPVLAKASADPAIRIPLTNLLVSEVPWGSSFLDYLSANTTDVVASAQMVIDIYGAGGTVNRGPVSILVLRLLEVGDVGRAWKLYARANPASAHSLVRNGNFTEIIELPTPFDWQVADLGEARAEISGGAKGELLFEARNGSGGTVARQRVVLTRGSYSLSVVSRVADGAVSGETALELVCIPSGTRIAQVRLDGASRKGAATRFSVPLQCQSQSLELRLDAGGSNAPIEGSLASVVLARGGEGRALQ